MYNNLKRIVREKRISNKIMAELLGISIKAVSNKINGHNDWTYKEVVRLKKFLFPEYDLDWLFEWSDAA